MKLVTIVSFGRIKVSQWCTDVLIQGVYKDQKKKTVGKEFNVSDPTREGYVFLGWSLSASATVGEYSTEDLTALAKGTVVYAVWELAPVVEETPQEPDRECGGYPLRPGQDN